MIEVKEGWREAFLVRGRPTGNNRAQSSPGTAPPSCLSPRSLLHFFFEVDEYLFGDISCDKIKIDRILSSRLKKHNRQDQKRGAPFCLRKGIARPGGVPEAIFRPPWLLGLQRPRTALKPALRGIK